MSDWASGAWQALAITLAQPLRKAFDGHCAAHRCGDPSNPEARGIMHCPEAWTLWGLLPDGDRIMVGSSDSFHLPPR